METFLQQCFNGIMLGSTYALVALGLTLVFGILHIPNYAHGNSYMLSAYISFTFIELLGLNYWLSMLLSAILLFVIGYLLERLVFRPLQGTNVSNSITASIGIMMIFEALVRLLWGTQGQRITNPYPMDMEVFGIIMSEQRIVVIVATLILLALLVLFIEKTITGSSINAVAQNREGAALMGINVSRVTGATFGLAMALCAIGSTLVAPIFMINNSIGSMIGLKCFVVVIIGGLGSIPGALVGGYLLGLVEAMGAGYLSATYKDVYAFALLIILLAIKPTGLFGKVAR